MIRIPEPSPEQQIIGCSLSNFLADRRHQILSEWLVGIQENDRLPATDQLTLSQLRDHVPEILDDLNRTLNDAFDHQTKEHSARFAAYHGHMRWEQRYDIAQLIREIGALRMVLIHHLVEFQEVRAPESAGKPGLFAMVVVHTFFDRMIRLSVEQFLATSKVVQHPQ
ncbi:MAG TPA: RsbRD N-terminal domain-containing protein [Candidatus Limnocylindria bacterium]|jgi:hypothetical protein|nr:RsbRD N-terminal domain-containing protein [Candidatus Limnocylindria bacterium]